MRGWWQCGRMRSGPIIRPALRTCSISISLHLCRVAAYGADGLRGSEGKNVHWRSVGCSVAQSYAQQGRHAHQMQNSCRVAAYGSDGLRGLEGKYARLVAALSDAQWPTQRWPVHVFTAGAMTCLLTSSFCHLFGCCDWHWTKVGLPSCCRRGHQARPPSA